MKSASSILLKLMVTAVLLVLIGRTIDIAAIGERFAGQGPLWLAAAALATAIQIPLVALRWRQILKGLGIAVAPEAVMSVTYIGSFWSNCLLGAAAGDVARAMLAPAGTAGRAGIIHSVLFDRAATFTGLVIIIAPIAALDAGPLARSVPLLAALGIAVVPVIGMIGLDRIATLLRGRRFPMSALLAQLAASWRQLRRAPGPVATALLLSVLGQASISATVYCLARAQHLDVSFLQMLILMPPVVLLTALPISAGGWGLREGAIIVAMAPIGVTSNEALLISIQMGILAAVMSLPGGLVWLLHGARGGPRPALALRSAPTDQQAPL